MERGKYEVLLDIVENKVYIEAKSSRSLCVLLGFILSLLVHITEDS